MYFAVDAFTVDECLDALQTRIAQTPETLQWYALLDCAMAHRNESAHHSPFPPKIKALRNSGMLSLYSESPLNQMEDFAPALLAIPKQPEENRLVLRKVLSLCKGKPMLSFVCSHHDAKAIRDYWQSCVYPECGDGQHLLLRFADTRVTEVLPNALAPEHWGKLCQALSQWWIINRRGELTALAVSQLPDTVGNQPSRLPEVPDTLVLQQSEIDALTTMGLADAVINFFDDQEAIVLPDTGRADFYAHIQSACDLAHMHGVESFSDITALSLTSALTQGHALQSSALKVVLNTAKTNTQFSSELATLMSDLLPDSAAPDLPH